MFLKNLNWNFVGLQALITIICMKIADIVFLNFAPAKIILPSCEIFIALLVLLFLRKNIRGSFGSLEIFIGTQLGFLLLNQNLNWLATGTALVAIWLLKQNELKPGNLPKEHYLWTTVILAVFAILAWYCFGVASLKWIIAAFIGWIFQMTSQLSNSFQWQTNSSLWYPEQIHSPYLWVIGFLLADYGITGLHFMNGNINLGLALIFGGILQKDKIGRWFSSTRLIAVSMVAIPEILYNTLQFLLQYY
jgi:hypothetical protein